MLDRLTQAIFAPLVGKRFVLHETDSKTVEIELIQATTLPPHPGRGGQLPQREPFSLWFRGPRAVVLPQRIYPLEHESLGRLDIFLVPIGPDEAGQRYEAIFN